MTTNTLTTSNLIDLDLEKKIFFVFLGVITLFISSQIKIPFYPVPMTLQTMIVFVMASSFGMIGFYTTLSYILLGLSGLPIFAYGGGPLYIFNPTFGFLLGMLLSSYFIAKLISVAPLNKSKNIIFLFLVILLGACIVFLLGIPVLGAFYVLKKEMPLFLSFNEAIINGLKPFLYSELLKISLSTLIAYKILNRNN